MNKGTNNTYYLEARVGLVERTYDMELDDVDDIRASTPSREELRWCANGADQLDGQ